MQRGEKEILDKRKKGQTKREMVEFSMVSILATQWILSSHMVMELVYCTLTNE
jgi:hypothetical protein